MAKINWQVRGTSVAARLVSSPQLFSIKKRLGEALVMCAASLFMMQAEAAIISGYTVTGGSLQTGEVALSATTGSSPFNNLPANIMSPADACTTGNNTTYTPGNDPCATDLIVRSGDTVIYEIRTAYSGAGAHTVAIVTKLPMSGGQSVADWLSVPPQCSAGSSLSADKQTLTCLIVVSAAAPNGNESILPEARVRPRFNGTQINTPVTTITDSNDAGVTLDTTTDNRTTVKPVTISAAPLYDVYKGTDRMGAGGGNWTYKEGPSGEPGWVVSYAAGVRLPYGIRGIEGINASGITFTDDPSNIIVTGAGAATAAVQTAIRSSIRVYNSNFGSPNTNGFWPNAPAFASTGCFPVDYNNSAQFRVLAPIGKPPFANTAGATVGAVNGVNTCEVAQSAAGQPISITLKSTDWTTPNLVSAASLTTVAPYDNILISHQLSLWFPDTALAAVPTGSTITIANKYTGVTGLSANTAAPQPLKQPGVLSGIGGALGTGNEVITAQKTFLTAGSFAKQYNNTRTRDYPFQNNTSANSLLVTSNIGTTLLNNVYACDKIDNTKNIFVSVAGLGIASLPSSEVGNPMVSGVDYVVEFGTGGLGGVGDSWVNNADFAAATCADSESLVWYASAAAVPGGFANITKVRFKITKIQPSDRVFTSVNLKVTTPSTVSGFGAPVGTLWPNDTKVNNWGTVSYEHNTPANAAVNFDIVPGAAGGVLRYWIVAEPAIAYDSLGRATQVISDTGLIAYAVARITKEIAGQVSATNPSQAVSGSIVNYVLKPTLSALQSGAQTSVQVTDVLPVNVSYVPASASIAPLSVQNNTPATGNTTIVWEIPSVTANSSIPPITFQALVSSVSVNGLTISNFAKITSPQDPTPACSTTGVYAGYTTTGLGTSGALCPNAARRDVTVSATDGFRLNKVMTPDNAEPGFPINATISWVGVGTAPPLVDIIDILPFVGDGVLARSPATIVSAPGTLTLTATQLSVVNDPGATFYYTTVASNTINADPNASTNGGFGSAGGIWLACPSNVCPVTSKAVRMISATAALAGQIRSFTLSLQSTNTSLGDVFANTVSARTTAAGSVNVSGNAFAKVVTGSLGGNVYIDANNDGSNASDTGIGDVKVCLSGYSFGLNGADDNGAGDDVLVLANTCQQTATSGVVGSYKFNNVLKGKYTVTQKLNTTDSPGLVGKLDGKDTAGNVGGTATNGLGAADDAISSILMPVGADATGYNFGEVLPASISGKTFNDVDSSGVYNALTDLPLANHLVTLKGLNDKGETVLMYACTNATGNYSFTAGGNVQVGGAAPTCTGPLPANPAFVGLRPGSYIVEQNTPPAPGFIDTTPTANLGTGAATAGVAATNQLASIVLASGNTAVDYNFGDTIKKYNVTGAVFYDANGNTDGLLASTGGTAAGSTTLRAVLVGSDVKVISSAVVNPDGTYSIPNVPPGTGYTVRLVNSATAPVFQSAAPTPALPAGWQNTGEATAAATGTAPDATVDGIGAPFDLTAADVPNRNFAIQQPPVAGTVTMPTVNNPGATNTAPVPAGLFTGTLPAGGTGTNATDTAPGAVTSVKIPTFPTNTTSITINGVTYFDGPPPAGAPAGSLAFPAGGVTVTTEQLAGMTLDPTDGPNGTPQNSVIDYFPIDAAGAQSATKGTVTLQFTSTGYKVGGTVFNDTNGNTDTFVNGIGTEAPATGVANSLLSAYLVGPDGLVKATSDVAADGTYLFTGVPPATGYIVVLANKAPVAADIGVVPTAASLPAGWKSTGEKNGSTTTAVAAADGTQADGKTSAFDVVATDVVDRNLGIQQPPVAGIFQYNSVPNPGGTDTLPINAGAFMGTVPVNGTGTNSTDPTAVAAVRITGIPANVTSITINGVKYGPGFTAFPPGGVTLTPAQLAGMVVDPVDGTSNIEISYVAIDGAGAESAPGKVTLVVGTPGKVDVVKSVGVPEQTGLKSFKVPYKVVIGNVVATAPTVYNVQANDNLASTYPAPATYTVTGYQVQAAGGAACNDTAAATPFAGTAAASAMLIGTDDLKGGESCIVSFFVSVDYGTGTVPTTANNNTAYGSGMGSNSQANPGATITNAGVATPPPGATTSDPSTNVPPAAGGLPGALPATPALPTTAGTDTPAPTPVSFSPQKIDTVKAVGVPKQIGLNKFEVDYNVVVGNVGPVATTPKLFNVQANDNMKSTFPATATYTVSGYTVASGGGTPAAVCTPASPAFDGTATNSKLLKGEDDLIGGQSCEIKYKVTIDYGATPPPTTPQNNSAYASATGSDTVANPGYVITDAGVATPPAVGTAVDKSVTAAPTTGPAGTPPGKPALPTAANGDAPAGAPTPLVIIPQKIDTIKAVGTPKQISATKYEIDYSVVVGNVGATAPTVFNVQANDNLKATFPSAATVVVSGYTVAPNMGTPAPTCTAATAPAFAGTAAASGLLAGTDDLLGGQSCLIKFKVTVDYAPGTLPATPLNNSVYASGVGDNTVANPGYTVTDAGVATPPAVATILDTSVDNVAARPPVGSPPGTAPTAPALPATPGADAPAGVPTPVTLTPQKTDVVKAAGVPLQVAPKIFEIPYSVVVANVGATSPTVFNVQANDNLKLTYPTATSIVVSNYAVAAGAGTPAGICAVAAPAFAGTAAASKMLSGTGDLAGGQSCVITFKAKVDFGAGDIPTAAQNNSVYASGVGSDTVENAGYTVPDTGAPTAPPTATTTDISVAAPPTLGVPGTPPATPAAPATPGGDAAAGVQTPVTLTAQKIDVVKAVGVPKQIGAKVFEVNYSVVVANVCKASPLTCATTPTVYNVQANDNLANTFPTATSVVVSNYVVTKGANGATCTAASPDFAGTATTSGLLSGANDLAGGQTCIITFKAIVDFGANPLPTVTQNNSVYASGTGTDSIVNPGYTYAAAGKAIPPANASTTDISATAPPTTGAPGTLPATPLPPTVSGGDSELGVPTPIILEQQEDGELQIRKSTITKEASAGGVVEYVISVTNTSSSPVKTKVTDTPPVGFEYVAGSAKIGSSSVSRTSSGGSLIFDVGTIPAKSSITLTYKMKLGDAVEAGDAKNCVSASGVNTVTNGDKESGQSCATVIIKTGLFLEKRANVTKAELGDSVEYSLRVKSVGGTTKNVTIDDKLPLGFKLIAGTVKVIRAGVTSSMADPAGSPGPALTFKVGTVANKEVVEIRYRLRLGIGADLGDGINRAQAKAPFATSSLVATAKVIVTRGVFTREACIAGKVYVDCNQNKVQDKCEAGSKDACEPGIPGVRLYMEDGTNITTDENGQYSICGVRATSHAMVVDLTTMPIGSRMGITSNENLGSGKSLLLNIKAGELHRADFIESSCYPKILDQVKQRQANSGGVVNVPLTQTGQDKPGIVFDAKEQELLAPALRGVK